MIYSSDKIKLKQKIISEFKQFVYLTNDLQILSEITWKDQISTMCKISI